MSADPSWQQAFCGADARARGEENLRDKDDFFGRHVRWGARDTSKKARSGGVRVPWFSRHPGPRLHLCTRALLEKGVKVQKLQKTCATPSHCVVRGDHRAVSSSNGIILRTQLGPRLRASPEPDGSAAPYRTRRVRPSSSLNRVRSTTPVRAHDIDTYGSKNLII